MKTEKNLNELKWVVVDEGVNTILENYESHHGVNEVSYNSNSKKIVGVISNVSVKELKAIVEHLELIEKIESNKNILEK